MAFEIKDEHIFDLRTIFEKKSENLGLHFGVFLYSQIVILGFQKGTQDKVDFESVLASILGRFSKAWESQK